MPQMYPTGVRSRMITPHVVPCQGTAAIGMRVHMATRAIQTIASPAFAITCTDLLESIIGEEISVPDSSSEMLKALWIALFSTTPTVLDNALLGGS